MYLDLMNVPADFQQCMNGIIVGHSNPQALYASMLERWNSGPAGRSYVQRFARENSSARVREVLAEAERLNRSRPDARRGAASAQERLAALKRRHAEIDHRWPIAIHEAGHAVAAVALRVPGIVSASIQPRPDSEGRVLFIHPHTSAPLTEAVVCLAGCAAESLLNRRQFHNPTGADSDDFERACARAGGERESVRAQARSQAVALIRERWSAVDSVARELVACERVGCDRLRAIVEAN